MTKKLCQDCGKEITKVSLRCRVCATRVQPHVVAATAQRRQAYQMWSDGKPPREIAADLGVKVTRVYGMVRRVKRDIEKGRA